MKKREKANPVLSDFTEKEVLPMWTPDKLIRNKTTGQMFRVAHVYGNLTLVFEINCTDPVIDLKAIPPREYPNWATDDKYEGDNWKYKPVHISE